MLALFAGRGDLPATVVAALDQPALICALEGNAPTGLTPEITFRLETLGSFLLELGNRGVTEMCFCGGIDRPQLDPSKLDAETAPLVPLMMDALGKGDDGALRVVIDLFEQTGFTVRGAHELVPSLLMQAGVPTRKQPRRSHKDDARFAVTVLEDMGRADLGQACVVRKEMIVAREDDAGTDAMLTTLIPSDQDRPGGNLLDWLFSGGHGLEPAGADWLHKTSADAFEASGAGGILFKAPKPGQDRRADLPTIGPQTALNVVEAGIDGIVIEAGGVIVLEPERVVQILDAADLFLWVRP